MKKYILKIATVLLPILLIFSTLSEANINAVTAKLKSTVSAR